MKRLTTILMLLGLVLVSTPHLLCPLTCGHGRVADTSAKCPHCRTELPPPNPTPSDDCHSPCCDGVDAVIANVLQLPPPSAMFSTVIIGDTLATISTHTAVTIDYSSASNLPPGLERPGCALVVLLAHLLL